MSQFKINEELIDRIKKLISSGDKTKLIENLKDVHYADIAEIFELLDITEVVYIIKIFDKQKSADALAELDEDIREGIIENLSEKEWDKNMEIKTTILQNDLRVLLGIIMIYIGLGHLTFSRIEFQAQVPTWITSEENLMDFVILASGIAEIIFGVLMVLGRKLKVMTEQLTIKQILEQMKALFCLWEKKFE